MVPRNHYFYIIFLEFDEKFGILLYFELKSRHKFGNFNKNDIYSSYPLTSLYQTFN